MKFTGRSVLLAGLALCAGPAVSEGDLASANDCILAQIEAGQSAAPCVAQAQAECIAVSTDTHAVAALCFTKKREIWSDGIAGLMKKVAGGASAEIAAVAGIEVKYDLLAGLLQCDRMEELALAATEEPAEAIRRAKAQCMATTSGLAYARLLWRTRDME